MISQFQTAALALIGSRVKRLHAIRATTENQLLLCLLPQLIASGAVRTGFTNSRTSQYYLHRGPFTPLIQFHVVLVLHVEQKICSGTACHLLFPLYLIICFISWKSCLYSPSYSPTLPEHFILVNTRLCPAYSCIGRNVLVQNERRSASSPYMYPFWHSSASHRYGHSCASPRALRGSRAVLPQMSCS